MNLSFRQLQAFVLGADCQAFSAAAQLMGISQPGYSLLIRQMEETLGFRLFDRSTRRVALTPAATEWLPSARRSIQQMQEARRHADDVRLARRGALRLGVVPSTAYGVLPALMITFRKSHPTVRIELREESATRLARLVADGQVDLGLGPLLESAPELCFEPLLSDDLVLLASQTHPLARLRTVTWKALLQYDYIAPAAQAGVRVQADLAAAHAGIALTPLYEASSLTTLLGLVHACQAFAILPRLLVAGLNQQNLALLELGHPHVSRDLGLLYPRGTAPSPVAQAFAATAREHYHHGEAVAAVAEQLSGLNTARRSAKRRDWEDSLAFRSVLIRQGGAEPQSGDELPV
jgi:LysR family carnitine catabolism transcriptional activator